MRSVLGHRPLILLFLLVACAGCTSNQRQSTLLTSLIMLDEAQVQFATWDEQRQARIIEQAESREEGKAKLEAYRADRDGWVDLFKSAWDALKTASKADDEKSLREAVRKVRKLVEAFEKAKGGS